MIFYPPSDHTPDHGPKSGKDQDKVHKDKPVKAIIHFIKCWESDMCMKMKPFITDSYDQPIQEIVIRLGHPVE